MRSIKAKLKKPAVVTSGNKDDWTKLDQRVWHSVAANQPAKLAAKLAKHDEINVNKMCPSVGYSVVHYAAAKGLDDCLNVLLAHKADVSTRDVTGATPLHAGARYGHKGTTTKLLHSQTVEVNARDYNQCTALHFAAFEGHLECVKLIADQKDCDVHCVDKDGRTILMVASAMGRLAVCEELINRGIDVNRRDLSKLQHTALTLAAEAGYTDVVKLLCESGADYAAKLSDGKNALDVAKSRNRRGVVDALHIIQLTEAAKKTDRGVRLSTSSRTSSDKSEDKSVSEKRKSLHEMRSSSLDEPDDKWQRNSSYLKQEGAKVHITKLATDQDPNSSVLSLYNDQKLGNLYDRDVSLYDSKSTLASVSSLDASSVLDGSRSFNTENPSTPQTRIKDLSQKQVAKLNEELLRREEQIALLEARLNEVTSDSVKEIESLKNTNAKYKRSVQELERAKEHISVEYKNLLTTNEESLERIKKFQEESERLNGLERNIEKLQSKLVEKEEDLRNSASQLNHLSEENLQIMNRYKREQESSVEIKAGLNQLLLDIGKPNGDGDYEECLRLLKFELLQASEKSSKKTESEEDRRSELEQLQNRALEQDEEIEALKAKLSRTENSLEKNRKENQKLVLTVQATREQLQQAEKSNAQYLATVTKLAKDVDYLKAKLASQNSEGPEIKELEEKLALSRSTSAQVLKDYDKDKLQWKETEATFEAELKEVVKKYHDAKQEAVENEKVISSLRVERNQREAVIAKLERKMTSSENKRKELEVEANRARQQVTESKQRCSKLQDDITILRKAKKDLSTRLSSAKLYECTEVERKKIDSMKTQLEQLCKHIQESEKKYNETISVYRGHLLMAAKGELNPDVLVPLKEILKLREEPHSSNHL